MVDTLGARRAMLADVPETNEIEVKGNTPREVCQDRISQRVHRIRSLSARAEALAYCHVTRMAVPGQRTGRVNRTQDATGVRS